MVKTHTVTNKQNTICWERNVRLMLVLLSYAFCHVCCRVQLDINAVLDTGDRRQPEHGTPFADLRVWSVKVQLREAEKHQRHYWLELLWLARSLLLLYFSSRRWSSFRQPIPPTFEHAPFFWQQVVHQCVELFSTSLSRLLSSFVVCLSSMIRVYCNERLSWLVTCPSSCILGCCLQRISVVFEACCFHFLQLNLYIIYLLPWTNSRTKFRLV